MILDYLLLTLNTLRRRRLRSWLTILGIFIGIAAVVSLISLSQGLQTSLTGQFERAGLNRIIVSPGSGALGPGSSSIAATQFTERDLDVIRDVKGAQNVIPTLSGSARVRFGRETQILSIIGMGTDKEAVEGIANTNFFDLEKGRQLRDQDRTKAITGQSVTNDAFDKKIRLGNTLEIEGVSFEIIGLQGPSTDFGDVAVRIPLDTAREVLDEPEKISNIFVIVRSGFTPREVANQIETKLRRLRNVDKGEEDFSVQTAEELIASFNLILDVVQAILISIAAISLVVGGVGIMNTMYTSVIERRREIGIMKSIGATNASIQTLFLLESGILGTLGGIIGIVLGLAFTRAVEIAVSFFDVTLEASYSPMVILGALAFSFVVGSISGLLPAIQAARLKPIDALKK